MRMKLATNLKLTIFNLFRRAEVTKLLIWSIVVPPVTVTREISGRQRRNARHKDICFIRHLTITPHTSAKNPTGN